MNQVWFAAAWGKLLHAFGGGDTANQDSNANPDASTPSTDDQEEAKEPRYGEQTPRDETEHTPEAPERDNEDAKSETSESTYDGHEQSEAPEDPENLSFGGSEDESETGDNEDSPPLGHSRNADRVTRGFHNFLSTAYTAITVKIKAVVQRARDYLLFAIDQLKEQDIVETAKAIGKWIRQNPWKTALIVLPLLAVVCTAIALSATGFGATGVAAGSAAAIIQSGIGNVVAHSLFAACTSAMMGGYGAPLIFGGVWVVATAITMGFEVAWRRWNGRNNRQLVRLPTELIGTVTERLDKAFEKIIFNSMVVTAFAVYLVKSWWRNRGSSERD